MRYISDEEFERVAKLHEKWLNGDLDGEQANLAYTDLTDKDLSKIDLKGAILEGAKLYE